MEKQTAFNFTRSLKAALLAFSFFVPALPAAAGTAFDQLGAADAPDVTAAPAPSRATVAAPVSFDQAAALILSADKRVYLTTLALPGDADGRRMAALLKDRRRAGLDVRLSVDEKEAEARRLLLRELSIAGVKVRVFKLSSCSSLVPYSRLLLTDGRFTDLDSGADAGSSFILPNQQAAGLDDAIVFFFTANDDGSKPKSSRIMSSCQGAPQGSPLDDSIVFFFTANDDGSKPN